LKFFGGFGLAIVIAGLAQIVSDRSGVSLTPPRVVRCRQCGAVVATPEQDRCGACGYGWK